ncbi:hypothetical protein FRB99_008645, partial [Tulasnella sp. 403]
MNLFSRAATPVSSPSSSSTSTSTPTPSATASWTTLGCYADQSARTLNAKSTSDPAMTYQKCQTFCAGFTYAGTENGNECWCGNSLTTNQPLAANQCQTPCAGNSAQVCGGGWKITIFSYGSKPVSSSTTTTSAAAPTLTGYTSKGCYVDQSARTLNGPSKIDNAMTLQMCQSFCSTYAYFGVENSK